MRFLDFNIKNYKGIQDCTIDVNRTSPRVISLIGLNESGKTTVLEALNYFVAGDRSLQKLYEVDSVTAEKSSLVPKSKKLNFNDTITISARVEANVEDIKAIDSAFQKLGYTLIQPNSGQIVTITQNFFYKNSTYINSGRTWSCQLKARKSNGTKVQSIGASHPCWKAYFETLGSRLPQICYFPTFLFDFPEKIFIEPHTDEEPVNAYYRKLLQDILDSLDQGLTLQSHIIDRIRGEDREKSWADFTAGDERDQVNHLVRRASVKITSIVLSSWKRVFNSDLENKRIEIDYEIDSATDLITLKLNLIDGDESYKIGDRSLGFRWFFCFWLFTYFRTSRSGDFGVVFLIDEPASNLHARAQEEILKNLEKLASDNNIVVYSTHSHYLISPKWLDRAYIVSNGSLKQPDVENEFVSQSETDIKAVPYKVFAGKNPNQRNYFIPVLDALEYRPSELTISRPAIIVEGKADYAFFKSAYAGHELAFSILPASGAKSMGPLISLLTGWGFPFLCLLDDDKEGRDAKKMYLSNWNLDAANVQTISHFDTKLMDHSLEQIILSELDPVISAHFHVDKADKQLVQSYVYEMLATDVAPPLTPTLINLVDSVKLWAEELLL